MVTQPTNWLLGFCPLPFQACPWPMGSAPGEFLANEPFGKRPFLPGWPWTTFLLEAPKKPIPLLRKELLKKALLQIPFCDCWKEVFILLKPLGIPTAWAMAATCGCCQGNPRGQPCTSAQATGRLPGGGGQRVWFLMRSASGLRRLRET